MNAKLFDARIEVYLRGLNWFAEAVAKAGGLHEWLDDMRQFPDIQENLEIPLSQSLKLAAITAGLLNCSDSFEELFRRPEFAKLLRKADKEWAQRTENPVPK